MKITKYFLALSLCIGLCGGCYEDQGNYKYTSENEVLITLPYNELEILLGESISITPKIENTISEGAESDYEYTWCKLGGTANLTPLYDEKNIVDWEPPLKAGTYYLVLRVFDKRLPGDNGTPFYSEKLELKIVNPISAGLLVLSEVNNVGRAEILPYFRDDFHRYEATGLPTLNDPLGITYYRDYNSPWMGNSESVKGAVVVHTKHGAYRLKPADMTYDEEGKGDLSNMIIGIIPEGNYVERILPSVAKTDGECTIVDNHGNVMYYSRLGQQSVLWTVGLYLNAESDGTEYNASPHVVQFGSSGCVLYNEDSRSFYYSADKATTSSRYEEADGSKMVNTGRDLIWMKGRQLEGNLNRKVYALMTDAGGSDKRYLVTFCQVNDRNYLEYDLTPATDITKALDYEMTVFNTEGKRSLFYYMTEDKIYLYDFVNKINKVVYTAEGGRKVTFIKNIVGGDWEDNLIVATYDPSSPADSGMLEVFVTQPNTGEFVIGQYGPEDGPKKDMRWTGFGKIIGSDWKIS